MNFTSKVEIPYCARLPSAYLLGSRKLGQASPLVTTGLVNVEGIALCTAQRLRLQRRHPNAVAEPTTPTT